MVISFGLVESGEDVMDIGKRRGDQGYSMKYLYASCP
jgi:hypothetical protein